MQTSSVELVRAAMAKREVMGFQVGDAYRVVDGEGDGMPGIFIDSYAGHWVVGTRDVGLPEGILEVMGGSEKCKSVWRKRLEVGQKDAPEFLGGERLEGGVVIVDESHWKFEIQLGSGYSQGIFLDQRENRKGVFKRANEVGGAVLNLFAYTCGFSVVGATAGAETVSVDLSKNYLNWGRRNFELNGLGGEGHGFMRDDAFAVLKRFRNRGQRFSGIVLDPPTFSRNDKGKVFRVESDYGRLVEAASAVLAEDGWMLCSSNTLKVSGAQFRRLVEEGVGRRVRITEGRMPADFTGEKYLKSLWVG